MIVLWELFLPRFAQSEPIRMMMQSPLAALTAVQHLWVGNPCSLTFPLPSFSYPSMQSNRKENKGGYLCHSCVEQRIGPLAFLTASPEQVRSMERTVEDLVLPRHEALLFLVF